MRKTFSLAGPQTFNKDLSLLKELVPRLERVGLMREAGNQYGRVTRSQVEGICKSINLVPTFVELGAASEIDSAIGQLVRQRAQAVMLYSSSFMNEHGAEIVNAATKQDIPTMALTEEGGALIMYRPSDAEADRVLAYDIDRILRGARPAELPVQQPTQFEMVINLKAAKALGITVPQSLLMRADRVIQ